MESIRELFRIGVGPSASHTMGPKNAAEKFLMNNPKAAGFKVTLFGSLAATGKGHLTDKAILDTFRDRPIELIWKPHCELPLHPNGMEFEALAGDGTVTNLWRVYSIGGGALRDETANSIVNHYQLNSLAAIITWTDQHQAPLWKVVEEAEGTEIWDFLRQVWQTMEAAVVKGINTEGILPGDLQLPRKSRSFYQKARRAGPVLLRNELLFAYALAVSEENAAGGVIVSAPTCGSCGVVPAVLKFLKDSRSIPEVEILQALATAGLIGNLVKTNGSISGAEVGCQGEIGTACAMAAAAACQLFGGAPRQIEYAAEMGFEHHLGLTCDPVAGLVQIPCIERNAFAATRAVDCAEYALLSDGNHRISFDEVVDTMMQTGKDLKSSYRETSTGGLAILDKKSKNKGEGG